MVWGGYKHIIFIVHFISVIGTSAPPQIIRHLASGPITSWEIDGETVEPVPDFIFGGSRITADGDCSHEIKRYLLLGRQAMTNLDRINAF